MSLFKYMNEFRIEDILVENKIRFTQPAIFNDPFEVKLSIKGFASDQNLIDVYENNFEDTLKEEYNKNILISNSISFEDFLLKIRSKKELMLKEFIQESSNKNIHNLLRKDFDEIINSVIGILSLTNNPKNLLMWSHYANEHKGFVIELEKNHSFFEPIESNNFIYNGIQKVKYLDTRPYKYLRELNHEELFLTKSKEWEYEDEYRIIKKLKDSTEIKEGDIYLFKFPIDLIKSIYFGCNMKDSKKNKILKLIEENKHLHHIKVYNTDISDKYYELEFTKVR